MKIGGCVLISEEEEEEEKKEEEEEEKKEEDEGMGRWRRMEGGIQPDLLVKRERERENEEVWKGVRLTQKEICQKDFSNEPIGSVCTVHRKFQLKHTLSII